MNPPHSTVSPSPASSIHTKEYAASSSTHTTYTSRAHSNKSVRSAIHSLSASSTGSEETIIQSRPKHSSSSPRTRTRTNPKSEQPQTETQTRTRRRKKHHLHRNFSRTTSTPSVDTYTTTTTSSSKTRSTETRSSTTRSSSSPPPYSRHPPYISARARLPKRLQPARVARALATLDDLGALLFFRLPLYLGGRKTIYILDDLGIWGFLRPVRRLGSLYERVEERWSFWRDWR